MERKNMKYDTLLRLAVLGLFFLLGGTLEMNAQCIANAGPDRSICETDCDTLGQDTTRPNLIYQWNGLNGATTASLSDDTIAQPEFCAAGVTTPVIEFQFIVFDNIQLCSDTDTVSLVITPNFTLLPPWSDSTICNGDTVVLGASLLPPGPNYVYTWSAPAGNTISDPNVLNPTVNPTSSGNWILTVEDTVTNCTNIIAVPITVEQLQVNATPAAEIINPGQRVQLNVTSNGVEPVTYTWSPETYLSCTVCPDPVSHAFQSTSYTVQAVDADGCRGSATVTITTDSLLIPNVFSPNNDGINDVLLINYYGDDAVYEILIYDRWGVKVFETRDRQVSWDGRDLNNNVLPTGVYYMYVRIVGDPAIPESDKQRAFAVNLIR